MKTDKPTRAEFLHFHRATIGEEEEREVVAALRSGWLTTGPRTKAFEGRFAEYVGAKHAIGLTSCTAALHLSLEALGLGPGDEVITTPITWAATANVIVHTGATPVFADVDPDTLCIDHASVAARITERTKALIPVDYAGQPCDLDALQAIAEPRGIAIVEDAAHAIETVYRKRKVGSLATTTCFSFYATKNLTTGEGGMVTTNDDALAERLRILSLHGISRDAWKRYSTSGFKRYQIVAAGFKYNMFDLQAALGLCQLDRLDGMRAQRAHLVARYRELLANLPRVRMVEQIEAEGDVHAFHLAPIQIVDADEDERDRLLAAIQAENIGVGIHFPAVHLEPFYRETYGFGPGHCPVAESFSASTLSLPLYPSLTESDQDDVVAALRKVLR
jgi:dTDP-4-amino-4,6-dideoxygalactose transaminase